MSLADSSAEEHLKRIEAAIRESLACYFNSPHSKPAAALESLTALREHCASLIADKNEWFAEAAKQATRAHEAMLRAEVAEAALREARANAAVECPNCAAMCNSETRTCWNCNALLGTWVAVGDAK